MADQPLRVEMVNICKHFGGVYALNNVNLQVKPGEIHALMGENGAGKSTLMKILSGAYQQDSGDVFLDGEKVQIKNPKDGIDHGISVIYQEFALIEDLSVAENIYLDHINGIMHWKDLKKNARDLLDNLGFNNINESATLSKLSIAYQQVVEIAKALSRNSKVLILDEPTALLASSEVEQLFKLLFKLKQDNVSIIYVSHRLEEIFRICDRITVLKDGKYVDTVNVKDADEKKLVSMMIGRDLQDFFPERNVTIGEKLLEVKGLNRGRMVRNISFCVKAGEVLGIGGLVGAGRTETIRAIVGADKKESGQIYLKGKEIKISSPADTFSHKIGYLPEDRKRHGILLELPIRYNSTMSCIDKYTGFLGKLDRKREVRDVSDMAKKLNLKTDSIESPAKSLSGGNQQKVAVSKLLIAESNVYIFDEPTRGVDVGAKREIYTLINTLAEQGNAVIMISSEMTEIIGMCNRALIMRSGEIVAELCKDELTEQNFINYSMGVDAK